MCISVYVFILIQTLTVRSFHYAFIYFTKYFPHSFIHYVMICELWWLRKKLGKSHVESLAVWLLKWYFTSWSQFFSSIIDLLEPKQLHLQDHVGSLSLVISALMCNFMVVLNTAYIAITVSNSLIIMWLIPWSEEVKKMSCRQDDEGMRPHHVPGNTKSPSRLLFYPR